MIKLCAYLRTNAVSWSCAKGQICVRVTTLGVLGQKPIWVEPFRVWKVLRVTMNDKHVETRSAPSRNYTTA